MIFRLSQKRNAQLETGTLAALPPDEKTFAGWSAGRFRHLPLLVLDGKPKSKSLCGHDVRHRFVAGTRRRRAARIFRPCQAKERPFELGIEHGRGAVASGSDVFP